MPRSPKMPNIRTLWGNGNLCPPGFFCMSNATLFALFFACVCALIVSLIVAKQYGLLGTNEAPMREHRQRPTVVVVQSRQAEARPEPRIPRPLTVINPDPRFSPMPPEQTYSIPPDVSTGNPLPAGIGPMVPINIQTRGYSDTFQQIGLLTTPGGSETSASPNRTILPLFGRKLMTNRDRWNYYTRTDGMNPVQVPVQFKRRDCDEDTGCDEIMNGDSVGVPILGQSYIANVYRYSTPRYIPVV